MYHTSPLGGRSAPYLQWYIARPSENALSPLNVKFHLLEEKITGHQGQLSNGSPKRVKLMDGKGGVVNMKFEEGDSEAKTQARNDRMSLSVEKMDETGQPTTGDPKSIKVRYTDGTVSTFKGDPQATDFGEVEQFISPSGRKTTLNLSGYEVIRGSEGEIRQIRGPGLLADVPPPTSAGLTVSLYPLSEVSATKIDGVYTVSGTASAIEIYSFSFPNAGDFTIIQCQKTRGTEITVDEFTYLDGSGTWSVETNPGTAGAIRRNVVKTWKNDMKEFQMDRWYSKTGKQGRFKESRETWRVYGETPKLESVVLDPDNLQLGSIYSYYTDSSKPQEYLRPRSQVNANGSWMAWAYDSQGRTSLKVTPWLDQQAAPPYDLNWGADNLVATIYEYTPLVSDDTPVENDRRPRILTRKFKGQVVSKTFYVYGKDSNGNRYDIVERAHSPTAAYGDTGNLVTRTDYYGPTEPDWKQGRVKSRITEDDQRTGYYYERGTWNEATKLFSVDGAGKALRTTMRQGTASDLEGVAYETTQTINIENALGHTVRSETEVFLGNNNYEQIFWENRSYDHFGQLTRTENSEGEITDMVKRASCCGADEVTNSQGINTKTEHDALERITARIKLHPIDSDKNLRTEYTLDPGGQVLMEVTRDGANTLSLTSSYSYDGIGRLVVDSPHTGGSTQRIYDDVNRITTQINPDGSTVITERYLDGRPKSVTGTSVTSQYYEYGVNSDGSQWVKISTGPRFASSPIWSKITTNMLGQNIGSERPGHDGTVLVSTQSYNNKGQLIESTPAIGAATRYEYNVLGNPAARYIDVNGNDSRDNAGPDRIAETEDVYVKLGSDWWMENKSYIYDDAQPNPTLTGIRRQRLTGLGVVVSGKGTLVAETVSIDIHGNTATSTRYLDRATQTALSEQDSSLTTASPDSRSYNVNGLTTQTDNREPETGNWLSTAFDYDALERRLGTTDPRTGRSFVTYVTGKSLIEKQTDAAGHETLFAYYPDTDRRKSVTDPNSNVTTTAYTEDGQVGATWGATYPVVYEYDAYDRMEKLHTLRDPNVTFTPNVNQNTGVLALSEVEGLTSPMDTTTWIYEESTGLLLEKQYDDGKGPEYTYTPDGRLETRTWERGVVTTYSYVPETLELLTMDYSDITPDVTNTYDRLGRLKTTTDGFGTKTYSYNNDLQPASEAWTGMGLTNSTINRVYKGDGRPEGFDLGGYHIRYEYDAITGYFDTLTYTNTVNNVSHVADYEYLPGSSLIKGYTLGGLKREISYETNRNLINTVSNTWNTVTTLSAFDYTNDDGGRRTNREDGGTSFTSTQANTFGFNVRNEVTSAAMRNGTSTYNFDQIGNRTAVQIPEDPNPHTYVANALNQYTSVDSVSSVRAPQYDVDGNMTNDGDGKTLTWNGENRLIKIEEGDVVVENTYDGQGRRVRKVVTDLGLVTRDLRYFYDGWNLLYEVDESPSGAPSRRNVWGLDMSQSMQGAGGVGGLLFTESLTLSHGATYDANGNISEYIDLADGSIDAHLEYDAFGRTISTTGVSPISFGFSTKYQDEESGYYYYGFRYYDPEIAGWLNRDPIWENGGYNLYGFTLNNAVLGFDFLGLEFCSGPGSVSGPNAQQPIGRDGFGNDVFYDPRVTTGARNSQGQISSGPARIPVTSSSAIPTNNTRLGQPTGARTELPSNPTSSTRAGAGVAAFAALANFSNALLDEYFINKAAKQCREKIHRGNYISNGCRACCLIRLAANRDGSGQPVAYWSHGFLRMASCSQVRRAILDKFPGLERYHPDHEEPTLRDVRVNPVFIIFRNVSPL